MTTPHDVTLAAEVEAAVRAVPGVAAVYRTVSTLSTVVDTGTRLLGIRDEDPPLVRLEPRQDALEVRLAIGVLASSGASDTARRTLAAVHALLASRGAPDADVHLTVVHVDADRSSFGPPS